VLPWEALFHQRSITPEMPATLIFSTKKTDGSPVNGASGKRITADPDLIDEVVSSAFRATIYDDTPQWDVITD
jgi:hypothetical protein